MRRRHVASDAGHGRRTEPAQTRKQRDHRPPGRGLVARRDAVRRAEPAGATAAPDLPGDVKIAAVSAERGRLEGCLLAARGRAVCEVSAVGR